MNGSQAASHYQQNAQIAETLIAKYRELQASLREKADAVKVEQAAARLELAMVYLPQLEPEALQSAERLTGFRGFSRRDPIRAQENERHRLEVLVTQIAATEAYQRREYLVGPVGSYTRALAEAEDLLAPWQKECERFEGLADFLTLYELGYDTPRYAVRWLDPAYWRYWARGDAICDELGLADFGDDVLPAYEKAREPRDQWREQVATAQARVAGVHELVQRHDQAVARMQQLPRIYLEESQKMLAAHLELADPGLLAQWAGEDRGLLIALRKISGLQAKLEFLQDASEKGVSSFIQTLDSRRVKFMRKATKFRRPKHSGRHVYASELDPGFAEKAPKYEAHADKLELLAARVLAYDRYSAFELDNPTELWFYEFTGGKQPSRLTPGLRSWYESNPNRSPRHDPDIHTTHIIAATTARDDRDDALGYLS